MSEVKLDALIVRNLGDLDAAAKRLTFFVQSTVAKAIDNIVDDWIREKGWIGESQFNDDQTWTAPASWASAEPRKAFAAFYLEYGLGDDYTENPNLDFFWLTRLCGVGSGQIGVRLKRETVMPVGAKAWKLLAGKFASRGSAQAVGFVYEEKAGTFFRPIRIDPEALAKAIEDEDLNLALQPVQEAFDGLTKAEKAFELLIRAASKAS